MKKVIFAVFLLALGAASMRYMNYSAENAAGNDTGTPAAPVMEGSERGQAMLDASLTSLSMKITPVEVIEDSRCPADVQCIQAGTVRVRAAVESPTGHGESILTLDKAVKVGQWQITLTKVEPEPKAGVQIKRQDYIFHLLITKYE